MAEGRQNTETPESETLAYLEALERRATLRKIRRTPQREREDFL